MTPEELAEMRELSSVWVSPYANGIPMRRLQELVRKRLAEQEAGRSAADDIPKQALIDEQTKLLNEQANQIGDLTQKLIAKNAEIEKLSGKCGLLMVDAEASAKEVRQLRGIVDEMTTADGVHVRLGSKVFKRMLEVGLHPQEVTVRLAFRVGDCYSTREAAEAAREAKP